MTLGSTLHALFCILDGSPAGGFVSCSSDLTGILESRIYCLVFESWVHRACWFHLRTSLWTLDTLTGFFSPGSRIQGRQFDLDHGSTSASAALVVQAFMSVCTEHSTARASRRRANSSLTAAPRKRSLRYGNYCGNPNKGKHRGALSLRLTLPPHSAVLTLLV